MKILSLGYSYPAYLAAPITETRNPALVLIHSFKGLEPGYKTMIEKLATERFVAVAPEWQTFNQRPADDIVRSLVADCVAFLQKRSDVDKGKLGLTGFCAGGRFAMLLASQMP